MSPALRRRKPPPCGSYSPDPAKANVQINPLYLSKIGKDADYSRITGQLTYVPVGQGAWVIAHENAPTHVSGSSPLPAAALPTETYLGTDKKLNFFNGEGVVVWHRPAAHTDRCHSAGRSAAGDPARQ